MKIHGPKVGLFECPGGRIGWAMAGNANFALSAIQKAANAVRKTTPESVLEKLETALAAEYARVIYKHPHYKTDWNLGYWFLLAHWEKDCKRVSLFATEEITIHSISVAYECIGIGRDLGHYLLWPVTNRQINSEREASIRAAHMLARVKDHVPGCGGMPNFLALRNDGTWETLDSLALDRFAEHSALCEITAQDLLVAAADENVDDEHLEQLINLVGANARMMRRFWNEVNVKDLSYALTRQAGGP